MPPARSLARMLLAVPAIAMGTPAHAEPTPDNAITLEPLAVVFARTIALEYERGVGRVGVHVGTALTLGGFDSGESSGDYLSVGATFGARIYPWSEAPAGAWVGAFGGLAWVEAEDGTERSSGLGWSAGAMVGWTWILGSVFELSLGAGAAWYAYEVDDAGGRDALGEDGLLPALRLAVGVAF